MNNMLEIYLMKRGEMFKNVDKFLAYLMEETKGKIWRELLNNGFKNIMDLKRYLREEKIQ